MLGKGFASMDAGIEPTWMYSRRPLTAPRCRILINDEYIAADWPKTTAFGKPLSHKRQRYSLPNHEFIYLPRPLKTSFLYRQFQLALMVTAIIIFTTGRLANDCRLDNQPITIY
ncbi:hypothetical protein [Methylotuvimicrobium sp. KM1]|uniref:hypothetical protein n=1 Tax=Methylotuvimicrobium sp. KM1 TaxID=3377707 RepID=UPI00384DE647